MPKCFKDWWDRFSERRNRSISGKIIEVKVRYFRKYGKDENFEDSSKLEMKT